MNATTATVAPIASSTDPSAHAAYYEDHGYVVFKGLIDPDRIDALMQRYREDILPSPDKFFRQTTNHYERNELSPHGYVKQSFLDIHAYASHPAFREAALELFFSAELREALTALTGARSHRLMQTMLFDLNAETNPHQDWWYLDSVPGGQLLASWIALEDIAEDAGRFYVLPRSHQIRLDEPGLPHSEWIDRMRAHFEEHRSEIHAPALAKGDVLFWNSRTIHGALPTRDPRCSRKSLTAHFLPAGLTFGNLFATKSWVRFQQWNGHEWFANQPEYSLKADLASRLKQAVYDNPTLLNLARKFQRRSIADIS